MKALISLVWNVATLGILLFVAALFLT